MADPLDLDAIEADACHCHDSFKSAGMVDPDCPHEAILALVAEVRDLRAVRDAARRLLDRTENNELFAREAEALAEVLTRLEAGRG